MGCGKKKCAKRLRRLRRQMKAQQHNALQWHLKQTDTASALWLRHCWRQLSRQRYRKVGDDHLLELGKLGLLGRFSHRVTRRYLVGLTVGIVLMLSGSTMALNAQLILEHIHVPHPVLDAVAYCLHGIGSIPIISSVEPLWRIFTVVE